MNDIKIPSADLDSWQEFLGNSVMDNDKNIAEKIYQKVKIDLHRLSLEDAFSLVQSEIKKAYQNRVATIEIITGLGPQKQGKIFLELPKWLENPDLARYIKKFCKNKNNEAITIVTLVSRET